MRILFILTGVVLACFPGAARADGTAILIAGNAPQHARDMSRSAMAASIQAQGRKINSTSFNAKDVTLVKDCLSNIAPWPCMKTVVAARGIDQLVIGMVDTETSPASAQAIRLSGYIVVPDLDFAIAEERRCDPCIDDTLTRLARDLAQTQLRRLSVVRGNTQIAVHTTPPGATITFDGEAHGTSDTVITTYPGSHAIRIELDGHHVEAPVVEALDGKTVEVNVTMRPKDGGVRTVPPAVPSRQPQPQPSRLVPILLGSAGAAAAITGGVLIAIHDGDPPGPDLNQRYEYYYVTRTPGIITAVSGVTAIAVSIYMWRRQSRSAVTAVPLTHGVAVSWNASF